MSGLPWGGVLLACVVSFGIGYQYAPREMLDEVVRYDGLFRTNTSKVLSTTVASLRLDNKLQVFAFKGGARVWAKTTRLIVLSGRQELYVPAVVSYYIDLSQLTDASAVLDEKAKQVTVKLPPLLVGEIAFQPENATTTNGGVLTFSQAQVDELTRLNYTTARQTMVKQAQQASIIAMAQRQARESIVRYFQIPLRIAGRPDLKVVATFI